MLERAVTLFRLFGIPVRIDASWILIAVLVTWSLAAGFFPYHAPGLEGAYLPMGILGALGLFASIVFHEFAHALVGRRHGVEVRSVTLFVFGGVAEMRNEPPRPRAEFRMAIAGPAASAALGAVFTGLFVLALPAGIPALTWVLFWLAWANTLLATFNLIPAFPLDGGRVLRAALWHRTGSLRRATRTTSRIGSGFGFVLLALGVMAFLGGNVIGGVWWALIGLWLRRAASMSYQQMLLLRFLEGERVRDFMRKDPVTVEPSLSLGDLVENYIYRRHFKLYPVVGEHGLEGFVHLRDIKRIPRERWPSTRVRDILQPCSEEICVGPDDDMVAALRRMQGTRSSRLLVVEGGELRGIVALRDVMSHLSLRLELEGEEEAPREEPEPVTAPGS